MAHITYKQYRNLFDLPDTERSYEAYTETLWMQGAIYKDGNDLRYTDSGERVPTYCDLSKPPFGVDIELHYCPNADITYLMQYTYDANGNIRSAEVVGWHHGEPDKDSKNYLGKFRATFDL